MFDTCDHVHACARAGTHCCRSALPCSAACSARCMLAGVAPAGLKATPVTAWNASPPADVARRRPLCIMCARCCNVQLRVDRLLVQACENLKLPEAPVAAMPAMSGVKSRWYRST